MLYLNLAPGKFWILGFGCQHLLRTAEAQNISTGGGQNFEGWYRFALSFLIKSVEFHPSTFDIQYSLFDILFFEFVSCY